MDKVDAASDGGVVSTDDVIICVIRETSLRSSGS
jgi:hypothetical protein